MPATIRPGTSGQTIPITYSITLPSGAVVPFDFTNYMSAPSPQVAIAANGLSPVLWPLTVVNATAGQLALVLSVGMFPRPGRYRCTIVATDAFGDKEKSPAFEIDVEDSVV